MDIEQLAQAKLTASARRSLKVVINTLIRVLKAAADEARLERAAKTEAQRRVGRLLIRKRLRLDLEDGRRSSASAS